MSRGQQETDNILYGNTGARGRESVILDSGTQEYYNDQGQLFKVILAEDDHRKYSDRNITRACTIYLKDNQLHCQDGPAIIWEYGRKEWWFEGQRHRHPKAGPALIDPNGTKAYYQHGQLHREDGPALLPAKLSPQWYFKGERQYINK